MNCTICNKKLDMRMKSKYTYASYALASKGAFRFFNKDRFVFCNSFCKMKADQDWMAGKFESLHGNKKIDF